MPKTIILKLMLLVASSFALTACGGDNDTTYTKVVCSGEITLAKDGYFMCDLADVYVSSAHLEAEVISGEQSVEIITIHEETRYGYEQLMTGKIFHLLKKGWYRNLSISPLELNSPFDSGVQGLGPAYVIIENTDAGEVQPTSDDKVVVRYRVTATFLK